MMRRTLLTMAALIAAAAATVGCRPFDVETPDSFIELEDQRRADYDYRATTADGVVVAVQGLPNKQRGTLSFWAEAVRNKLRDARGYALLEESDVRAVGGMPGKQLRFGRDEAGHTFRYWVTIFVRHEGMYPRVWVIEAGGEQEVFESRREEVERLIATFEPR
jgi:hypothetical protein